MRIVKLKLDLPADDPRSSSILEEVIYRLLETAPRRTLDYLAIREVSCGASVARPDGDVF